ncbi:MAG TPA: alpha-2-macroglobulin family protein, partial [Blastocatellia bacterium]|nr:alpha-2-macroglobulin family protein [Blastocatellia bacterium]
QARVDAALTAYVKAHDRFPQDDAELDAALAESDIARADLRDGWGHMPYAAFKSLSRYADRVRLYSFAQYGEPARQKTEMTPVTQLLKYVTLRSAGADGAEGTADDFDLGNFSRLITEQAAQQPLKQIIYQAGANTAQAGALGGLVVDPQNALVPGAKVKATSAATGETFEATTDDEGRFLLLNLPAGTYEVRVDAQGFQPSVSSGVPVQAAKLTEVSVTLSVGTAMEAVMVTASAPEVQTQSVDVAVSTGGSRAVRLTPMAGASARQSTLLSTPRLREYFPETLVWQPSIETDAQGRASLRFKLADNITTWRLAVMASTADGRVGVAEADVTAFQPFFVEHDPPRVLTAGDEISLPVVVRNYLDRRQAVQVELSPADWFRLLGPSRQRAQVNAGDAARVTFDFRAAAPIKEGPQRVTAKSREAGDAIERRVSVHPDGEEVTATASQVFGETTTITTDIPETAIADTARGEVKIYPNLSAHVLEAIEAIMQRPYGCAEQAISSAYPSLLALRLYEGRGDNPPPLAGRARRYVQAGYERLLSYRDEAGGFSYWGRGEADVALTAYALQFLSDASRFVSVDERVMNTARDWLVKQQRADGSWSALDWRGKEDSRRMAMLTAVAARALARVAGNRAAQDKGDKQAQLSAASLDRALNYLSRRAEEIDEPYLIAAYALAASDAHQRDRAARVTARLAALARKENDSTYWSLETNTPYYGWGLAGRVETTALAVQALALSGATDTEARSRADAELINRGLLFLLRQKDRYGVWYSTQASVQALAALSATLSERETRASGAADTAEVIVNGKRAATLAMPRRDELTNPLTVDVSSYLTAGSNRVEIRRAAPTQASAQLVASHYEPWGRAPRESESNQPLRLKVAFDKTELKAGDEVTCHVEAERVGFDGYGMMLAEVGLPPGADVDRASLDRAMSESGWDFSQYDVLPDRLIVYLWPQAGGTRFAFKFKPRYGLKAQTAPSVLYDYYNPEARVTLAPTRFVVR